MRRSGLTVIHPDGLSERHLLCTCYAHMTPCDSSVTTRIDWDYSQNDGNGIIDLTERLGLNSHDPLVEYIRSEYDPPSPTGPDFDRATSNSMRPSAGPGRSSLPLNYENHIERPSQIRTSPPTSGSPLRTKATSSKPPRASSARITASNCRLRTAASTTRSSSRS